MNTSTVIANSEHTLAVTKEEKTAAESAVAVADTICTTSHQQDSVSE